MKDGLHQRNGFTLVELLVVISIIAIIAGLVVPALLRGREEAWKAQCSNNLKQIYLAAVSYAQKKYEFPRDKTNEDPTAHDSLNILLRSRHGKDLPGTLFKCPSGEAAEARKAEDEDYLQLDEDTLDYAWANIRRRPTGKLVAIGSDKFFNGYDENREGHNDVMNVLNSDSSIKEWEIGADGDCEDEDFDADLGLPTGLGR